MKIGLGVVLVLSAVLLVGCISPDARPTSDEQVASGGPGEPSSASSIGPDNQPEPTNSTQNSTRPPSINVTIASEDEPQGPAFEDRPLRLFADDDDLTDSYVLVEDPSLRNSGANFVNCGIVFNCTWRFDWLDGRFSVPFDANGTIQIAPTTDVTAYVDVTGRIIVGDTVIFEKTVREFVYINPILTIIGEPIMPAIVIPFQLDAGADHPSTLSLEVVVEATALLPGLARHDDWQYATGIEFDNVRVYENTNSTSRWI